MSFRELTMVDVKEVLRRFMAGQSARRIARDGVVDRKTAQRYLDAARACGLDLQSEPSDVQVLAVARHVPARPAGERSDGWRALEAQHERLKAWLTGDDALTLVRVSELLARDVGVRVPYTTLRRYAHGRLGWREREVTVRVADAAPGDEAQIDFGQVGFVTDDDGVRRRLWVLLVTLTMSRYLFVWPTLVQTLEAVCEGLDAAWAFFDGVVRRVVPDNMKAIVLRPDATAPVLQRAFVEYAQARGFFVDTARVRRPRDKGRVENQVPYVRERWFAGERFAMPVDLAALRAHAATWCREVAGARVHGTTRAVPREVYARDEHPHMLPAPRARFDVPTWTTAKVHPDHHVQVDRALYSVPTRYVGATLDVRYDRASVRLYVRGELVKVHPRTRVGGRVTDPSDYPTEKAGYATRSVDAVRARARETGPQVSAFMERLLDGPLPWIKMRQAYALLRLCDRYGVARVEAVCARALAFDVLDVGRVERMLRTAQQAEQDAASTGKVVALPPGRFARDASVFATKPTTTGTTPDATTTKGGAR